jgi:hypothetical protein
MPQNRIKKTIFWLFQTIFPTRMGLLIWLVAYFQGSTLGHTSCSLAGLCAPFWVHLGVPNCPRTAKKLIFWLLRTTFFKRTGLMIWLGPIFKLLCTFLGPFGGAEMPKESIKKNIIWLFWTIFPRTMGLMIWLDACF